MNTLRCPTPAMCNACGFSCCAVDTFDRCGCDCEQIECLNLCALCGENFESASDTSDTICDACWAEQNEHDDETDEEVRQDAL